jgi:hypothetical protein
VVEEVVVVVDGVGQEACEVLLLLGLEGLERVGHVVELLVLVVPVVAEPGGGLDEVPPLRREVLHLAERLRDEERRVRVERRGDHGAHGFLDSFLARSKTAAEIRSETGRQKSPTRTDGNRIHPR